MSKKSEKKFELVIDEQTQEPKPWSPSYPGELPPIPMSPEEIERAEAEKLALLSTLPIEPRAGERPTPVVEIAIEEPVSVVEPIIAPEPGELEAAKGRVAKLLADQKYENETREIRQKAELAEALKEQGRLEQQTVIAVDADTSRRLREAISSIKESKAGDAVLAARADAGTERQEALKRRAAHALGLAAQMRQLLKEFDKEFGVGLEAVRGLTRDELLLGVPNVGRQAEMALALYGDIQRALTSLDESRAALDRMLQTDSVMATDHEYGICGGFEKEITTLVEQAKAGWSNEQERQFVTCVKRLAQANPDAITTLQLLVRGISGRVAQLKAMQSTVNVEPIAFDRKLPTPDHVAVEKFIWEGDGAQVGRPPRADDWSPFGEVR